ncbi:MAG: hypothetical protein LRY69_07320 [Gammaproteobacteria bacterium]|nr:hypothetical protein [Gammaproteobacteria bacterium]
MNVKKKKKFSVGFKALTSRLRRNSSSAPEENSDHALKKYQPIKVTPETILLSSYTNPKNSVMTDEIRAILFSFMSSNLEKEDMLWSLLSRAYDDFKRLIPDTADEYRKKISAHNNQTTYVPTPQSPVDQKLREDLKISANIQEVFYQLIFNQNMPELRQHSTAFDLKNFEDRIDEFFKNIDSFWENISRYLEHNTSPIDTFTHINELMFIFKEHAMLNRHILPSEVVNNKNVNKFLDKLSHFNAFSSIVCVLMLGILREQNVQLNQTAWGKYKTIIKFLTDYSNTKPGRLSNKNVEKLTQHMHAINVALPLVKREWLIHWKEEHPNITDEEENYITNLLELNIRNMDIRLHLVYNELVISVLPTRELSGTYGLNIFPERLHPEFKIRCAALDEKGREPYSILKAGDIYLLKKGVFNPSIKKNLVATLEAIYAIICKGERKNSLELIGFVFYFILMCVENSKIKSEHGSDMAKALREFAVTEIGVDLGHYRTLFDNHIRPKAYRSHVAKKSEVEEGAQYDLFVLNIALTAMVVKCAERLSSHQLQFAIRANGYLSLLYIDTLMENLRLPTPPEGTFRDLGEFNSIIRENTRNYTDKISSVQLTEFQKIKLSFIFVLIFYREMLANAAFDKHEEYQALFAHILAEYFLPERPYDKTAYHLACHFFNQQPGQTVECTQDQKNDFFEQITVSPQETMILRTIFSTSRR